MNVVITGASRGIGKAVADIFAANGHNLYICSRQAASLYKAAEELITKYPDRIIMAQPFDLSKKEEAIAFGNWVIKQDVSIDVLVNNAGLFEPGSVYNEPDGTLESQVHTNLYSAYHVTRTLLPKMMTQNPGAGTSGHIFNICSTASIHAYKNGGAYSISKFALYGFSQNLREEMKPHRIKVTAVLPGAVMTGSWDGFDNTDKRIMEAQDVAKMIYASAMLSPQACVEEILIRPQLGDL